MQPHRRARSTGIPRRKAPGPLHFSVCHTVTVTDFFFPVREALLNREQEGLGMSVQTELQRQMLACKAPAHAPMQRRQRDRPRPISAPAAPPGAFC